jgi:hypothetical protein
MDKLPKNQVNKNNLKTYAYEVITLYCSCPLPTRILKEGAVTVWDKYSFQLLFWEDPIESINSRPEDAISETTCQQMFRNFKVYWTQMQCLR